MKMTKREMKIVIFSLVFSTFTFVGGVMLSTSIENITNRIINWALQDEPQLKATVSHGGYSRYYFYTIPETGTLFRVYPLKIKVTNIGTVPFTIHSVIPYSTNSDDESVPRVDLLIGNNMEYFTKKTFHNLDVEEITAKAYIRESLFGIEKDPLKFNIAIETEVIILGTNKQYQKAAIRSINMDLDGLELVKPESNIVDFENHELIEITQ